MSGTFRVWLKFNAVGIIGFGVQLIMLTVLKSVLGLHYLAATFIAVESTVLHNFVWHERWTWFERTSVSRRGIGGRLVRFHLANGVISVAGNVLLTWFFVSQLQLHYFLANIIAVGTCSIANFVSSDRFVFKQAWRDGQ